MTVVRIRKMSLAEIAAHRVEAIQAALARVEECEAQLRAAKDRLAELLHERRPSDTEEEQPKKSTPQAVLEYFQARPAQRIAVAEVLKALPLLPAKSVRVTLDRLVRRGQLQKVGRGVFSTPPRLAQRVTRGPKSEENEDEPPPFPEDAASREASNFE